MAILSFVLFTFVINALLCLTQETPRYPGGCPDMAPSPPFEENKIVGTWVSSHITNQALKWVHCAKGSVEKVSRGLYFDFKLYNSTSFVQSSNFTLKTNEKIPGFFNITADDNFIDGYDSIIIENDYFMVWGCCNHENEHSEAAYIQSKFGSSTPDDILEKFFNFLSTHGSFLKREDFFELPDIQCQQ